MLTVYDIDEDAKFKSETKCLAIYEIAKFEFLLAIIIWYDILFAINSLNKNIHAKDICIDDLIEHLNVFTCFFYKYRKNGFENTMNYVKKIASEMNVEP